MPLCCRDIGASGWAAALGQGCPQLLYQFCHVRPVTHTLPSPLPTPDGPSCQIQQLVRPGLARAELLPAPSGISCAAMLLGLHAAPGASAPARDGEAASPEPPAALSTTPGFGSAGAWEKPVRAPVEVPQEQG